MSLHHWKMHLARGASAWADCPVWYRQRSLQGFARPNGRPSLCEGAKLTDVDAGA